MTNAQTADLRFYLGLALRLVVLIAILLGAVHLSAQVKDALGFDVMPHNEALMHKMILLGLLSYVLITALPFVPGAEIGMTLLTVFGAQMAPFIYLATILSLTLAYSVGRLVPLEVAARTMRALRIVRIAEFLEQLCAIDRKDRAEMLITMTGHPALQRLARHRYVALAVLINVPGNAVIGGGGGLAFAVGMSGVFSVPAFLLTVAIAVLPVPLAIFAFGA